MTTEVMSPDVRKMSPAERLTNDRCPECGLSLIGQDALHHRNHHWPKRPADEDPVSQGFIRYRMLTQYAKEHPVKREV